MRPSQVPGTEDSAVKKKSKVLALLEFPDCRQNVNKRLGICPYSDRCNKCRVRYREARLRRNLHLG